MEWYNPFTAPMKEKPPLSKVLAAIALILIILWLVFYVGAWWYQQQALAALPDTVGVAITTIPTVRI